MNAGKTTVDGSAFTVAQRSRSPSAANITVSHVPAHDVAPMLADWNGNGTVTGAGNR